MFRTFVATALVLLLCGCASTTGEREAEDLVQRWIVSDGVAVLEIGSRLTDLAIENPDAFFAAFAREERAYESWLDLIDTHSFRDFTGDESAALEVRLKALAAVAERRSRNSVRQRLAAKLRQRLATVTVTVVD